MSPLRPSASHPSSYRAHCAFCQIELDPVRASAVRFWFETPKYFCSQAHAERFEPSAPPPTGRESLRAELFAPKATLAEPTSGPFDTTTSSLPPPLTQGAPNLQVDSVEPNLPFAPRDAAPISLERRPDPPMPASLKAPFKAADEILERFITLTPLALIGASAVGLSLEGDLPWPALATLALSTATFALERHTSEGVRSQAEAERRFGRARMDVQARIDGRNEEHVNAAELKPGQEISVRPGEIVAADGVIVSGRGLLESYPQSHAKGEWGPGHAVLGGTRFLAGETLTLVCHRTSKERVFSQLARPDPLPLIDELPAVRDARRLRIWGAPTVFVLVLLLVVVLDHPLLPALLIAATAWAALASPLLGAFGRAHTFLLLKRAEAQGVSYPSAESLRKASQVGTAVFCARGTVQAGAPELSELHPLREQNADRVLSLAAGALLAVHHPTARAVVNAARKAGVHPDPCRNHNSPGAAAVSCTSSEGHDLVLGNREYLLKHKISVAWAEDRLRAIETQAQSALLIAENHHIIGVLALSDELLPGARGTMQKLIEAGIEPALLSGDSREATEGIAARLGIDHVRPEARASERRAEVEGLRSAGVLVAAIGRAGLDDATLAASDVPIALGGLRNASVTFAPRDQRRTIGAWGGEIQGASVALLTARQIRADWQFLLLARLIPASLGVTGAALLVLPPALIPLFSLVGYGLVQRRFAAHQRVRQDPQVLQNP